MGHTPSARPHTWTYIYIWSPVSLWLAIGIASMHGHVVHAWSLPDPSPRSGVPWQVLPVSCISALKWAHAAVVLAVVLPWEELLCNYRSFGAGSLCRWMHNISKHWKPWHAVTLQWHFPTWELAFRRIIITWPTVRNLKMATSLDSLDCWNVSPSKSNKPVIIWHTRMLSN